MSIHSNYTVQAGFRLPSIIVSKIGFITKKYSKVAIYVNEISSNSNSFAIFAYVISA